MSNLLEEAGSAEAVAEVQAEAVAEAQAEAPAEAAAEDSVFRKRTFHLPIERRLVGALIGPAGSTVKAIQQLTGTRISIKADGNKNFVYIYGTQKACERGRDVVERVLSWYKPEDK